MVLLLRRVLRGEVIFHFLSMKITHENLHLRTEKHHFLKEKDTWLSGKKGQESSNQPYSMWSRAAAADQDVHPLMQNKILNDLQSSSVFNTIYIIFIIYLEIYIFYYTIRFDE